MHEALHALSTLLKQSSYGLAFTGAGISTESGIPDFRSPGGIWDRYQPILFEDFLRSEDQRRESWRRKMQTDKVLTKAQPNQGHFCIAQLVKTGAIKAVITQNIDGLHQASGIDDKKVIELHGNSTYAKCLDCEQRYDLDSIFEAFARDETLPACLYCGGIVKSATVSFGQPMPAMAMAQAERLTERCDLFIVVGSSLNVYPAAAFPELAKARGAKLAIINREPTPMDGLADVVINDEIGTTLGQLQESLSVD